MRRFESRPAHSLKHPVNWLRSDMGDLPALAASYLAHAINPIVIRPDGTTLDGNRRLAAVMQVKPDAELPVCVTDEPIDDSTLLEIMMESAEHTKSLTPYEKYQGMTQWLALNPTATAKDLAAKWRRDPSQVCRVLALSKCIPAVVDAAREGKLDVSAWSAIAKLPPDEQPVLLELKLSGASRDELEQQGRKRRNGNGQPVARAGKIKWPLPSGTVITIAGNDISLDEAIEAMKDALKAMTKARDTGLDAKTAQAVAKDVAKAG